MFGNTGWGQGVTPRTQVARVVAESSLTGPLLVGTGIAFRRKMVIANTFPSRPSRARLQPRSTDLLLLLPWLVAIGCATPAPVLRLSPQTKDVVWVGGTEATTRAGKTVRAAVAFVREQGNQVAFRVEIENLTDTNVLLEPARFYAMTCARKGTPPTRTCGATRLVSDPERMLLALDMKRSRDKAGNANAEAFWGTMVLLDATLGMASAVGGHGRGTTNALVAMDLSANAMDSVATRDHLQATGYELERANWSAMALRKTTLFPGKRVAGLVFTERDESASEVWLHVRLGDDILVFPFNQTVLQVRFNPQQGSPQTPSRLAR